jgi:hypothetical protein
MKVIATAVLAAAFVWGVAEAQTGSGKPTAATAYRARLSQVPVDTPMLPNVTGTGTVAATLSGRTLTISGNYEGLQTAATVARVHRGAKGIRGPAVFDLKVSGGTSGTISGSIELSPAQLEDLARERFYVQLHSEKAPDGNLWGWLLPQETRR